MTKIRIVTHNAGFHADDVFGVATLMLLLGKDNVEVIRSREQAVIDSADYVLDTGFVYDSDKNRFDHHQKGGAGGRENGIPYASFGLIWKKFGSELCGSQAVAEKIDRELVQPIDAFDNGVQLYEATHASKTQPLLLQYILFAFEPARGESKDIDTTFFEAVDFACHLLERKIVHTKAEGEIVRIAQAAYESADDKRLIVIDADPVVDRVPTTRALMEYPEPIYFVRQHENGNWQVVGVPVNENNDFTLRKALPEAWAGKKGGDFASASGVADAVFCHNGRFMAVAESKEGALELARFALEANSQ